MSIQREKGTRFETAVCRYIAGELQDVRVERRALHGSKDMGDLFGIYAHGFSGIAECKAHQHVTPKLVAKWREETLDERDNADADFALLVIKVPNVGTAQARCHVTLRDLARIARPIAVNRGELHLEDADSRWVSMTLEECCALMVGE